MGYGLNAELVLAAVFTAALSVLFLSRDLRLLSALFVSLIKVSIAVVYFAYFPDAWSLSDDLDYLERSQDLLDRYSLWELLATDSGMEALLIQAQGHHTLYYIWNIIGQWLFGDHYYSPVFLNIALTALSGFLFARILQLAGFSRRYIKGALVFFLLQWDVLVWSSFFNLKDILVMTLTLSGLFSMLKVLFEKRWRYLLLLGLTLFTLFWVRFYIAFFILFAGGIWLFRNFSDIRKWPFILAAGFGMTLFLPQGRVISLSYEQLPQGLVRFLLTPQPWSIDPLYSFLWLPSVLHWLMVVPALYGAVRLWRRSPVAAILLGYGMLLWLFYGLFPELQGPRHRVQITFLIAWMQFHFLWLLLPNKRSISYNRYRPPYSPEGF